MAHARDAKPHASLEPEADGTLDGAPGVQHLPLLSDLQHALRCQRPPSLPRELHQLPPAPQEGSTRRLTGSAGGPRLALAQYIQDGALQHLLLRACQLLLWGGRSAGSAGGER